MARGRQTDDISYTEGVRRYCGEKISSNAWTEKTAAEYASTFDLVRQILRHNPAMRSIGHREANSIKETFSSLPPNMTKGIFSGKTVRQVLKMNPTKTASPQTVRLKLQRLSSLFEWAKKHGYTDLNPFTGIAPKNRKPAKEQRNRYTLEELQTLFAPTHFNRDALRQPFKYWLPVLGLYTGARLAELIQLRPQDVIDDHDIPHLCILPDADYRETGKIKTVAAERKIPIHPKLIELGFLRFVGEQRARGLERLFPEAFCSAPQLNRTP